VDIENLEDPKVVEDSMPDVLRSIISYCVVEMNSYDLGDLVSSLNNDQDSVRGNFCDQFDLGEQIYDAFELYDVDVEQVLCDIKDRRYAVEQEAAKPYSAIYPRPV
jgi:hypothetical protein